VGHAFQESVEKRTPFEIEYRLQLKNGRVKWIHGIGRTEYGNSGRPVRAVGTIQDITLHKLAEETIHESEARFRSVLENSLDAAYRRDLQTDRYDYMSPVIEQITGWTVAEMCNSDFATVLDRIHPDDLPRLTREIEMSMAECRANGKASSIMEYRFRSRDGEYRWLADHNIVIADDKRNPAFRLGNVRDITYRKRREAERELLLQDLQEAAA
jgi:PAS domain S-box-containing protein